MVRVSVICSRRGQQRERRLTILRDKLAHELGQPLVDIIADDSNTRDGSLLHKRDDVPVEFPKSVNSRLFNPCTRSSHVEHRADPVPGGNVRARDFAAPEHASFLGAVKVELERVGSGSVAFEKETRVD